jgi:RHS repeat-associated protein
MRANFTYDDDSRFAYFAYIFTGKERDTESGLDYFGARYYGSSMRRFMSPDWSKKPEAVPYSDRSNPQSLNLYGYVNNNPLSRADANGHFWHELWNSFWWGTWTKDTALAKANYQTELYNEWVKAGRPTKANVTVGIVYWIGPAGGASGEEADPSTPVGRRGDPINIPDATNSPQTINGREFSGHALDREQEIRRIRLLTLQTE